MSTRTTPSHDLSIPPTANTTANTKANTKGPRRSFVFAACMVFAAGMLVHAPAEARPRPAKSKMSNFEANKTFGLGLMFGAPTGLSGKYYLSSDTALDFGIGTIYGYRNRRGFHVHGDFLWHPVSLASVDAFELPLYLGVGGRLLNGTRCYRYDRGDCDYRRDYAAVGVRAPIGISFDFNNVPLDIFLEFALVLDFLVDRDDRFDDPLYVDLNGAFGLRYYFN
jgi:hypothetical protein